MVDWKDAGGGPCWNHGEAEARERIEAHVKDPGLRFDARDREAWRYLCRLLDERKAALGYDEVFGDVARVAIEPAPRYFANALGESPVVPAPKTLAVRMAEMLVDLEWAGRCIVNGNHCPNCNNDVGDGDGHEDDCELAALLKEIRATMGIGK